MLQHHGEHKATVSPYIPLGVLYLVQGFPYGLQSGLLPVLLRTQGLSLSHIGLTRVLYLPWLVKVLWSPLVDGLWSRGTWLLLSTGGLCLCCLLCSLLPPGPGFEWLACLLLLMHVLASVQDVALDAVSVAVLSQEQLGLGNSLQVVAYKLGSVLAGGGALTLLDALGWRMVFLLLAMGYLLAMLCVSCPRALNGAAVGHRGDLKDSLRRLSHRDVVWRVLQVPGTTWTIVYVLIYKLGEQGSLSMVPLLLLDQGVSPAELGVWNGILSLTASIAGSALGGVLLGKGRSITPFLRALLSFRVSGLVFQTLLLSVLDRDASIVKGKNMAPEGKASQVSVYHTYGNAVNAIDGNRDGTYSRRSCILTRSEKVPWWRVDLHAPRKVGAVVIVNRNDCCWHRLLGAEVRVGNETRNQNPVCGTISEVEPGSVTTFCCNGMVGRYVSVVIPDRDDILNLCEVEVYPEGTEKPCV